MNGAHSPGTRWGRVILAIFILAGLAGIGTFVLDLTHVITLPWVASSADPCPVPVGGVIWDNGNQGMNAYASPMVDATLGACQTELMTSGHVLGPDGKECGYQADQLCVIAYEVTKSQDIHLTVPDQGHTWVGRTAGGYEAALASKQAQFFEGNNCTGSPCSVATVLIYVDGRYLESRTLKP